MNKLEIYCITNKQSEKLDNLGINLVGVGSNDFKSNYIKCIGGENINFKERNYSELTFHYWFWKNKLSDFQDDSWVGFCQRRRFWLKSNNEDLSKPLETIILKELPEEWNKYNAVICKPIKLGTKLMKLLNQFLDQTISKIHENDFPNAKFANNNSMAIPLHNNMSKQDFEHVVNCIKSIR